MTIEQAIQLLHRLSDEQFDGEYGDERREALEMAVRALESNLVKESGDLVKDLVEDSSSDLISRQETIEYCVGNKTWHDEDRATGDTIYRQAAIDAVVSAMIDGADAELVEGVMELLPSAQPQWIPCSERLPEANGRYLVTRGLNACGAMWNKVYIINYSDLMGLKPERIWWGGNVGKSDFERFDDVIAWMPLPEPYGGEGDKK